MKTATSAMAVTALADNVMKERIVFLSLVSPFKEVTLVVCASLQQQIDYFPLGLSRPSHVLRFASLRGFLSPTR
jgi:hypothetical protein